MSKIRNIISEIFGCIANIVLFFPFFMTSFIIRFFGLSELFDKENAEDLP